MNHLRKAAQAGARIVRLLTRDPKTGEALPQRHTSAREIKNELKRDGLSGRQIRKLRKQLAREARHERPPRQVPPHVPGVMSIPPARGAPV
jgi:lipase chaperone LimK